MSATHSFYNDFDMYGFKNNCSGNDSETDVSSFKRNSFYNHVRTHSVKNNSFYNEFDISNCKHISVYNDVDMYVFKYIRRFMCDKHPPGEYRKV